MEENKKLPPCPICGESSGYMLAWDKDGMDTFDNNANKTGSETQLKTYSNIYCNNDDCGDEILDKDLKCNIIKIAEGRS